MSDREILDKYVDLGRILLHRLRLGTSYQHAILI